MIDKKLTITVKEMVNAPVSKVWDALTNKEIIKQYFWGTKAESEWEKGSPITFSGSWDGQEYLDKGTILEIENEKMVKYDYWSSMSGLEDKPENYLTVTYFLEQENGQTVLTIKQDGAKDKTAQEHSEQGWKEILKNLKELLEK